MPTLQQVFETVNKESPYSGAIYAQVCGKGGITHYKNASGQQRQLLTLGLADSTKAVKAILYDISMEEMFEVGSVVLLLNCIIKKDQNTIVLTKRTKIRRSTLGQKVPTEIQEQAYAIACPPAAAEISVKDVQTSPIKSMVSVKGQVTAVSCICLISI